LLPPLAEPDLVADGFFAPATAALISFLTRSGFFRSAVPLTP